jgi:hypothetical protein
LDILIPPAYQEMGDEKKVAPGMTGNDLRRDF